MYIRHRWLGLNFYCWFCCLGCLAQPLSLLAHGNAPQILHPHDAAASPPHALPPLALWLPPRGDSAARPLTI